MDAILIRWSPVGERAEKSVPNLIAAVLPSRTTEKDIEWTMQLLAHGHAAWNPDQDNIYVSELLQFARARRRSVTRLGNEQYLLGGNPTLLAKKVFNLVVSEVDYGEVLTWDECIYPVLQPGEDLLEKVEKSLPFPRRRWRFTAATNRVEPILDEKP